MTVSKKDEAQADETQGLLSSSSLNNVNTMPSPGSTDCPSASQIMFGYGSRCSKGQEEPLIQMSPSNSKMNDLMAPYADGSFSMEGGDPTFRRQMRRTKMLKLLAAGLVLLVACTVGWSVFGNDQETPSVPVPVTPNHHNEPSKPKSAKPLSLKHPVDDLDLPSVLRTSAAPHKDLFGPLTSPAIPTNAWYENLILVGPQGEPTGEQRVYPLPYLVDTVGPLPGLRVNSPYVKAGATDIQLIEIPQHGITLGASPARTTKNFVGSKKYTITHMTPLGITLEWNGTEDSTLHQDTVNPFTYASSIVRGMPYVTMEYHNTRVTQNDIHNKNNRKNPILLPSIATEIPLGAAPKVDNHQTTMECHKQDTILTNIMSHLHNNNNKQATTVVNKEVVLQFTESDFTWIVFVSKPVHVQCITSSSTKEGSIPFLLQFIDDLDDNNDNDNNQDNNNNDLIVRVALMNDCTVGGNPMTCGRGSGHHNDTEVSKILRDNVDLYPGPNTDMEYSFVSSKQSSDDGASAVELEFDWNVQSMSGDSSSSSSGSDKKNGLLMYALPHHQDLMADSSKSDKSPVYAKSSEGDDVCRQTLLGKTCLVQGSTWTLREDFASHNYTSFRAPRPPHHSALPDLVEAYHEDLNYSLPSFFQRGAGDTYFSGKMLAKLARILIIGEELSEICSENDDASLATPAECQDLDAPSTQDAEFQDAVARLRSGVEIWINGTGATPFVYDEAWGGMVSCGCDFNGTDRGGVCKNTFPECPGFEDPGLNFGNAFYNDHHFHYGYHIYSAAAVAHFDPKWGRKYFEQVMLYIRDIANPSRDDASFPTFRQKDWYQGSSWASGIAVSPINGRNQESSSESIAAYEAIGLYGKEMVSAFSEHGDTKQAAVAEQVFHYGQLLTASEVRSAQKYWHVLESSHKRQYPKEYTPHVIGMLWTNMAQFQTWFGNHPYLAIGIQLLPLTAVSEERDSQEWVMQMYQEFADSCDSQSGACEAQGWSVLVMAMLATVGHRDEAMEQALSLNSTEVFNSAGGNGHSLTNTLWYLSTRPYVEHPLGINVTSAEGVNSTSYGNADGDDDDTYYEYNSGGDSDESGASKVCPPCPQKVCRGPFNKCPVGGAPFLCTEGQNTGGCARAPWVLEVGKCLACCEVTYGCEN